MSILKSIKPLQVKYYNNDDMYISYVSYNWENSTKQKQYKVVVTGEQTYKVETTNNTRIVTIPYGYDIKKIKIYLTQSDEYNNQVIKDDKVISLLDSDKINNSKYRRIHTQSIKDLLQCTI